MMCVQGSVCVCVYIYVYIYVFVCANAFQDERAKHCEAFPFAFEFRR